MIAYGKTEAHTVASFFMDEIIKSLPNSLLGWFSFVLVGFLGVVSFLSRVRANDLKILRQTNIDQGARIKLLEDAVARLQEHVKTLEQQNKTLDDLVVIALKHYFLENPEVASSLKTKIIDPQK